jgi:peptide/nickel transport system ATP-binding protein
VAFLLQLATEHRPQFLVANCGTPNQHQTADEKRMTAAILEIRGLKTQFATDDGWVRAVDGVDVRIEAGETVGIVGESGCGKTVTAMSILKLLPMPPGKIAEGEILWQGRDLVPLGKDEMNEIRAKEIAIVFQEPMTSLNPVFTVGEQIAEVIRRHEGLGRKAALDRAAEMLALVQIPNAKARVNDFPHQFSGGMRQRVMIAMALSCGPKLLIADEPTTALDVTIQAQILDLLADMKQRLGMAVMLITHAMGVVAEVTQRVVVMYAGKVVEEAPVKQLFARPLHPYTQGLIRSIPRLDRPGRSKERLEAIPGTVPNMLTPPPGCRFAPRCKFAKDACRQAIPPLREIEPGHKVACVLY